MRSDPSPVAAVRCLTHWKAQANRTQAAELLGSARERPANARRAALALGTLQELGLPVNYLSLQRGMTLLAVSQQIKHLNQVVRRADTADKVSQEIQTLQQRARIYHLQTPPAETDAAPASTTMTEQQWLQPSANRRDPTDNERAAVQALLRSYQVPEPYATEWVTRAWQDMRNAGQAELALLLLADTRATRISQQPAFARLNSTQSYCQYLQTDAVAFFRVANQRLYPQVVFDRLTGEAKNHGVLTRGQLDEIQRERDPQRQTRLASLAYQKFRDELATDWTAKSRSPNRPRYGDFATFLQDPQAKDLFATVWNPAMATSTPKRLAYQAYVLDWINSIETSLGLAAGPSSASREALRQARSQVDEQIKLIQDRGVLLAELSDNQLSERALELLTHLQTRITLALTDRR